MNEFVFLQFVIRHMINNLITLTIWLLQENLKTQPTDINLSTAQSIQQALV